MPKFLFENVNEVEELGGMWDGFHDRMINLEMCYTSNNGAECSIRGIWSNSDNEKGSENETTARYDNKKKENKWK